MWCKYNISTIHRLGYILQVGMWRQIRQQQHITVFEWKTKHLFSIQLAPDRQSTFAGWWKQQQQYRSGTPAATMTECFDAVCLRGGVIVLCSLCVLIVEWKSLLFRWLSNGLNLNVFPNGGSSYWLMSGCAVSSVILSHSYMALLLEIEGTSLLFFLLLFSPSLMLVCNRHIVLPTLVYEWKNGQQ